MPTYDYECFRCGYVFEADSREASTDDFECPMCGGPRPVKRFTAARATIIVKNPLPSRQGRGKGR